MSVIKDPFDPRCVIDKDGLAQALKHFTSSTLTMRLSGITQINNYICIFNDYCQSEGSIGGHADGEELIDWILENKIIEHIFGPNLHVEVIKQSHIVLNFVVNHITKEHIDVIWSSSQLKHCSRQVFDILTPLIKNMNIDAVLHLYSLIRNLEPKDHTEHTLMLSSCLLKYIWTKSLNLSEPAFVRDSCNPLDDLSLVKSPIFTLLPPSPIDRQHGDQSSSSPSPSMEGSEDDDDEDYEMPMKFRSPTKERVKDILAMESHQTSGESQSSSDEGMEAKDSATRVMTMARRKTHLPPSRSAVLAYERKFSERKYGVVVGSSQSNKKDSDTDDDQPMVDKVPTKSKLSPESGKRKNSVLPIQEVPDSESPISQLASSHLAKISDNKEDNNLFIENQPALPHLVKERVVLPNQQMISNTEADNLLSDNSNSSQVSQSSQKNMADFDGEDSSCYLDIEKLKSIYAPKLVILRNSAAQKLANIACIHTRNFPDQGPKTQEDEQLHNELSTFTIENACKRGQTVLWDLLQDDNIGHLPEGLSEECEKILCNLICWIADRRIRMKFIDGCLENISNNHSVIVSLRLLPKLFVSFQQYRSGMDTHSVILWSDKERQMLRHFFNNLLLYKKNGDESSSQELYSHSLQIQARLQFLTFIFSYAGSPENFKLSQEQVDTLWDCISTDKECSDELFGWLLNQVRSRQHHALSPETLQYILKEKIPTLAPDNFSMITLEFLQQLFGFVLSHPSINGDSADVAMKKLWDIALLASNADVSMAAIRNLNNFYVHLPASGLEKEEEFIEQCMDYLRLSSSALPSDEDKNLAIIQRALVLLKTHLEAFRCRYSFHLRLFQLTGELSVASHRDKCSERGQQMIKIVCCHPGTTSDKTSFEMHANDYVGELRAEIYHWFQHIYRKFKSEEDREHDRPFEGTLRLISQGQELTHDLDEKTLSEVGFKDNQLVHVSVGNSRPSRKLRDSIFPASLLPPPPKSRLPLISLLQPTYFEQLFSLMQLLGSMKSSNPRAQVLSRQVWDIINILPTSPDLMKSFQSLTINGDQNNSEQHISLQFNGLLSPSSPQKLIYSVQIVEWLQRTSKNEENGWAQKFIDCVGLKRLFDIFVSGVLQQGQSETWNEWKQDCLASLLHLIYLFGIDPLPRDAKNDKNLLESSVNISEICVKRKRNRKGSAEKLLVHQFNAKLLEMLKDTESVLRVLMTVLTETVTLNSEVNNYQTRFWGRAQVVHNTLQFLVSWAFSDPQIKSYFFEYPNFSSLLKQLILNDPDPNIRREACSGFHRMCLGTTSSRKTGHIFIPQMLNSLLNFLPEAQAVSSSETLDSELGPYSDKEVYGPGCQDYFWLVCKLVDSLEGDNHNEMIDDLNNLCYYITDAIKDRGIKESRHNSREDEGLKGLLCLMTVTLKQNPPFKFSEKGNDFLKTVFELLFITPSREEKILPKCKTEQIRLSAFELLVELAKGCERNLVTLLQLLLEQHKSSSHNSYPWDYWPHDGGRSECGYVGLLNLGATCYMASCVQHLFMFPRVRNAILSTKVTEDTKHAPILRELKLMFAHLLDSERKAYNPKSFCKVYTMNSQPLNTGEQKDMTEFFTDLISKLEEMSPHLKDTVKSLFSGTLSNNVVSLDCGHISRTKEEFYTLRCKVADMKHIWDSLNELTVIDTLEGDNMYTCGDCEKKVRAEKRVCIEKLPHILTFNTMRYTYNMPAQTKEKVNTYFSFPMRLDMAAYLQENLLPDKSESKSDEESASTKQSTKYELVGVTVHTGNADGGHYYCFIKEPDRSKGSDKWYMFNDAEVKPFDSSQIAAECFGGEMTSKTYDSVNDKYMDFSIEKTNSAYMLFYERISLNVDKPQDEEMVDNSEMNDINSDILQSIWQDNVNFLQDKSIFEPSYFTFTWQVCGFIPQTLPSLDNILLLNTQLATSFVLETLIHSREKPMIGNWVDLLTKLYSSNTEACEWLINNLANEYLNWPVQILLKCPNHTVRQLFQSLVIQVIRQLRSAQKEEFTRALEADVDANSTDIEVYCVTRFLRRLLSLIEPSHASLVRPHLKHLTGYFSFLHEFAKLGPRESSFLLKINAISFVVQFYLSHSKGAGDCIEILSDEDEDDEEEISPNIFFQGFRGANPIAHMSLPDKYPKPASLDKMITFVSSLIENSRKPNNQLGLSSIDLESILGGKSLPFIQRQIRDNINSRQSFNLICSLCRYNENTANSIVNMLLHSINRQPDTSQPFFRILSMLVEISSEPPGMPSFSNLIYPRIWEIAEQNPLHCLEWLTAQVPRNKSAHSLVLSNLKNWVEQYLLAHNNQRVRNAAAYLIISLVPNNLFRQSYFKSPRTLMMQNKDSLELTPEAFDAIHQIFTCLLQQLKNAKAYVDHSVHGVTKLTSYFAVMAYCLVTRDEKLMLVPYFNDLWDLFQPKLSEPAIAINQNKQSLLYFWHQACIDCPENIKCIINNPHVTKNIAFNYILADHEDQDVILFNRMMLPSYYGLLRLCCAQSRQFTRQLALHQNIQWAFKNITPYYTNYQAAVAELFKLMKLFVTVYPDSSEQEIKDVESFKRITLQMYLQVMDARSCWTTLITALSILMESKEDQEFVIQNNGILALIQSFSTLFLMFHEATACHVTNEIVDLLKILANVLQTLGDSQSPGVKEWAHKWEDHLEIIRKLILLMNTFTPPEVRSICMTVLLEIVKTYPKECTPMVVQTLGLGHLTFQDQLLNFSAGPYFPRKGQRTILSKSSLRPPRPVFQMHFHPKMLEVNFGIDEEYDKAIIEYYLPYYKFVCDLCKIAVSTNIVNPELVGLCSMVAIEALFMHITLFTELWLEFSNSKEESGQEFFNLLCSSSNYFRDLIFMILTSDQNFLCEDVFYEILQRCLPKVYGLIANQHLKVKILSIISSIWDRLEKVDFLKDGKNIIGDLRVIISLLNCEPAASLMAEIKNPLLKLREKCIGLTTVEDVIIEHETPQKKRKTKDNSSVDDNEKEIVTDEMEIIKEKLGKTMNEFTRVLDNS